MEIEASNDSRGKLIATKTGADLPGLDLGLGRYRGGVGELRLGIIGSFGWVGD